MDAFIWKFKLKIIDEQEIETPNVWCPLCIQVQNNEPCLWAEVYPESHRKKRKILCFGTGQPIYEKDDAFASRYLGTVQIDSFVWHYYLLEEYV